MRPGAPGCSATRSVLPCRRERLSLSSCRYAVAGGIRAPSFWKLHRLTDPFRSHCCDLVQPAVGRKRRAAVQHQARGIRTYRRCGVTHIVGNRIAWPRSADRSPGPDGAMAAGWAGAAVIGRGSSLLARRDLPALRLRRWPARQTCAGPAFAHCRRHGSARIPTCSRTLGRRRTWRGSVGRRRRVALCAAASGTPASAAAINRCRE